MNMKEVTPKTKILVDLSLILTLLLLAGILYAVFNGGAHDGAWAVVRVNGEEQARYPLGQNGVYEINGGTNILVIESGSCSISEADCPDKLCVKQGRIHLDGQCIVCLPNKLTVTVYGAEKGPDGIVY